jgi:hypothetical protein
VFALFRMLLRRGGATREGDPPSEWFAWLGATIWLLHPLFASTVLYVVQRMAMLSAFFILIALLAYVKGRVALELRRTRLACLLLAIVVPLSTVLALLSKENGILAPALCAVIEWFVFQPRDGARRRPTSTAFLLVALALPAAIGAGLAFVQPHFISAGYSLRDFSLGERVLTETRALWDYVGAIVIPRGAALGFYHDDFPISRGLLAPPGTLLAILAWIATLAGAWHVRVRAPGIALGVGIYLVGHALESTIFPLLPYFEHRNYLPAIGVIWALLSGLALAQGVLQRHLRHGAAIFRLAAVAFVLILAAGTSVRAHVWQDQRTIIAQALQSHPESRGARFDAITWELAQHAPDFARARADADFLRRSDEHNTRVLGSIERLLVECTATGNADPVLVRETFDASPGPFEEDLMHAFEFLSDRVGTQPCTGLSPGDMAEHLVGLLDRWEAAAGTGANWRLRFRAANLFMAADRNPDAIRQARLAYANGMAPTNTSIMIAGVLLYCGDAAGATGILDDVEPRLRPSDVLAREIVRDDRARIARMGAGEAQ